MDNPLKKNEWIMAQVLSKRDTVKIELKVSVILTVLNEVNTIASTIENLLTQTKKPDEIVIVDGGSVDGTINIIKSLADRSQIIKLIVEKGVNISRGRNIAIDNALYPIIAATDSGCRSDKTWLEKMTEPITNDPHIDVVKGVVIPDPINLFETIGGVFLAGQLEEFDESMYPLSGRSSVFKKEIWVESGGYPEWLYTAEDTLYHRKLKSMGARIKLSKKAFVYWRPRQTFWKMAKMCFLYGRGNGRIGDSISGAIYHLRNYGIFLFLCAISVFCPWILSFLFSFVIYLYLSHTRKIVKKLQQKINDRKVNLLGPLIVSIRNISTCFGLMLGHFEYKYRLPFKKNLMAYMEKKLQSDVI